MVRRVTSADRSAILDIVEASGQFDAEGLTHVAATLDSSLAGGDEALWLTVEDGEPVGVAYCAPEPVTQGTWNLLMLWVRQGHEGRGHGLALVEHIERALVDASARLLIVETSGLPEFEGARRFYAKSGFTHEATIADFFAPAMTSSSTRRRCGRRKEADQRVRGPL